jgi:DNA-binding NarL/FixJ family response regulator
LAPQVADALSAEQQRQAEHDAQLASLSPREAEVLRLFAHGQSLKDMAGALGISPRTLETYKSRAMSKLNLSSRADVMRFALHCGWLPGDVVASSKSGATSGGP